MPERRAFLGAVGGIAGVSLVGVEAARRTKTRTDADDHGSAESTGTTVAYVRNVEEVRGHLDPDQRYTSDTTHRTQKRASFGHVFRPA